jgi:hypothetical protein
MRVSFVQDLEALAHNSLSTVTASVSRAAHLAAHSAASVHTTQWHDYTAKIVAGCTIFFVLLVGCILFSWIRKDIKKSEEDKAKEAQERQQLDQAIVEAKVNVEILRGPQPGGAQQQFGEISTNQGQFGGAPSQFGGAPMLLQRQSEPFGMASTPVTPPTWGFFSSATEPIRPQSMPQQTPSTWPGMGQQQPTSQLGQLQFGQQQYQQGPPSSSNLPASVGLEQAFAQMAGGNPYKVVDVAVMPAGSAPPQGGFTINLPSGQPSQNWGTNAQPSQNWGAQPPPQQQQQYWG